MKTSPAADIPEKKGHICPPSNAIHPKDRWESLFVYSFICKFTNLRGKVEGLETPMDFENALISPEANTIMTQILSRFVLNLKPQTRNLSADAIPSTISSIFIEHFKSNERMVFWDDTLKANIDPMQTLDPAAGGFWGSSWDLKLKVLRQLVELQLCHSPEIKSIIDRAWGVVHNKHKKAEQTPAPPPSEDPHSMESLQLTPLGQDIQRKRYWVIDSSPRMYLSTNPWKITATFQTVSTTREEYVAVLERLKESAPPDNSEGRRSKLEQAHLSLVKALEDRIPAIDAELARLHRIRRKFEQRQLLMAQAEVRETRTRRRTTKPDYVYLNDPEEADDGEYVNNQEDQDYDEQLDDEYSRQTTGRRRSTRKNNNDEWSEWRIERRSTRLGAHVDMDVRPTKRARTVDSTASTNSGDGSPSIPSVASAGGSGLKIKVHGAAAVKPTETAVETIAGKKKSKFWFYAVEPIPNSNAPTIDSDTNGTTNTNGNSATLANGDLDVADSLSREATEPPTTEPPLSDVAMNGDQHEMSVDSDSPPQGNMDES
ncbi:hypothetical protein C8Q75DRAFT_794775 [Abortiporus biennis]|nr:hypothetical protein C8Q75DRAFT_794775 [Abortiporus biennis]